MKHFIRLIPFEQLNLIADKRHRPEDEPSLRHVLQPVGPPLCDGLHPGGDADLLQLQGESETVQRWAKKWSLGCGNFLPGPAWLLLSKTGPLFSPSL